MKTFKEYADLRGITYNAVYQSVQAHKKELKGHLHKRGRVTYLDDAAIELLDEYRRGAPVVVVAEGVNEKIAALEDENRNLHLQLEALQAKLIDEQSAHLSDIQQLRDRIDVLTADNVKLLEDKTAADEKAVPFWRRWFK